MNLDNRDIIVETASYFGNQLTYLKLRSQIINPQVRVQHLLMLQTFGDGSDVIGRCCINNNAARPIPIALPPILSQSHPKISTSRAAFNLRAPYPSYLPTTSHTHTSPSWTCTLKKPSNVLPQFESQLIKIAFQVNIRRAAPAGAAHAEAPGQGVYAGTGHPPFFFEGEKEEAKLRR